MMIIINYVISINMGEANVGPVEVAKPIKVVAPAEVSSHAQSLFKELGNHGGMYPGLEVTIEGATRAALQTNDDKTKVEACGALGAVLKYSKMNLRTAEEVATLNKVKSSTMTDLVAVVTSSESKDVAVSGINVLYTGLVRAFLEKDTNLVLKAADSVAAIGLVSDQNKPLAVNALNSSIEYVDKVDKEINSSANGALGPKNIEYLRALRSVVATEKSVQ